MSETKYKNRIGVIYRLESLVEEGKAGVDRLLDLGIECVQLNGWDPTMYTQEVADKVKKLLKGKIEVSSFWCGWSGPQQWNPVDGPCTLGLVPEAYRAIRLEELKRGADFTRMLGAHDMATHVGFVPEQPVYSGYRELVSAVRELAAYCKEREVYFNFETGQETPVTLLRVFQDVGADNLGVNLDPANLILYGRGNPIDALGIYGARIRGVHIKDGDYTTDPYRNGKERVVGEGSVNYPVFLPKLLEGGYKGDLYIEREISGEQQMIDIRKTIAYIKELMA
ncbi:MAG: sugar phosphate isomerase/epimerase [Oscillospiraceae bacterium]|nr:sugar phosphate isomerase/epimerase [Oscillospiraceae bacterium]